MCQDIMQPQRLSCTRVHLTAQKNYYSRAQSQWPYFTDSHQRQDVLKFYRSCHSVGSPWADLRLFLSPAYFSIAVLFDYRHSHLDATLTDCPNWDPGVWFAAFPAVVTVRGKLWLQFIMAFHTFKFHKEKNQNHSKFESLQTDLSPVGLLLI